MTLHISTDGTVRFVAEPTALRIAEGLGEIKSRRASRIVPACPRRRLAFQILRVIFGDSGRVATWTRTWQGPWEVRFTDSPSRVSFSHASRAECLKWEVQQLNHQLQRTPP